MGVLDVRAAVSGGQLVLRLLRDCQQRAVPSAPIFGLRLEGHGPWGAELGAINRVRCGESECAIHGPWRRL